MWIDSEGKLRDRQIDCSEIEYNPELVDTYRFFGKRINKGRFLRFWKDGQLQGKYPVDETFDSCIREMLSCYHSIHELLLIDHFQRSDLESLTTYLSIVEKLANQLEMVMKENNLGRETVYSNLEYKKQAYKQVFGSEQDAADFIKLGHKLFLGKLRRELDSRFPIKRNLAKEVCDQFDSFLNALLDYDLKWVEEVYENA